MKEKKHFYKVEKQKKVTQMHFVTVSSHNKSMRYQRVVRNRKNIKAKMKSMKKTTLRNETLRLKERFNNESGVEETSTLKVIG